MSDSNLDVIKINGIENCFHADPAFVDERGVIQEFPSNLNIRDSKGPPSKDFVELNFGVFPKLSSTI